MVSGELRQQLSALADAERQAAVIASESKRALKAEKEGSRVARAAAEAERKAASAEMKAAATIAMETARLFEERLQASVRESEAAVAEVDQMQCEIDALRRSSAQQVFEKQGHAHSTEEFDRLSYDAQRQARSRAMQFLGAVFDSQASWRAADVATVLQRKDLLEGVWNTKEMWELRMVWARDLFAVCTSHHWGVKFCLYLVITEHLSKLQIARIAQVFVTPPPCLCAPPRPAPASP